MSKILDSVVKDLNNRENKGLRTYGTTVDREDYQLIDWLQETYEETLDSAMYLKAAIEDIKRQQKNKII